MSHTHPYPGGITRNKRATEIPVSSLRDEKESRCFVFRGYRFSQPPANLCNPYRDLRIPDTVITMGKLCPCFFQEKPRVRGDMLAMTVLDFLCDVQAGLRARPCWILPYTDSAWAFSSDMAPMQAEYFGSRKCFIKVR